MTRNSRLVTEGSWIVAGQIVSIAGALALVRVLTEYLAPAEFGQLALGLTVAGLINQVFMGATGVAIGRFYSIAAEKQDLGGYLKASSQLMVYVTAAVFIFGVVLIIGLLTLGYSHWLSLAAAVLVFAILSGYNSTLSGIQNAARQRAIVAFHGGLDAWLKILLAVVSCLWFGTSVTAVVIGYACASLVATISQLFFLRRIISRQKTQVINQRQWVLRMWSYSIPFTTWGAFTWFHQISDRWALQVFSTSSEVGQYSVLFQLGYTPITIVTGMAINFLGPILYQRSGDASDSTRNESVRRLGLRMTQVALFVTAVGFMMTLMIHEKIFEFLVASEYRGISHFLPWLVLAGGVFSAGQMLALKIMSEMKPSLMIKAKISTALAGALFNIIGVATAGVLGLLVALLAFSCVYCIWMALLTRRLSKVTG